MYSNKENVNILTALLVKYGVRDAVVCPGSRNAPIVHNLNECPLICCHPVTDERSAGFCALGIAQATDLPVVVCVTSGSALLGVVPAVAEACYQHQSLIVVSADRPEAWIDQLDGQTLRQPGACEPWVARTVSLPEPTDNVSRWHCNRLVCEALLETQLPHRPCVHINVPITEPLFLFDQKELPDERMICRYEPIADYGCLPVPLVDDLYQARRPMIVFGQAIPSLFADKGVDRLFGHVIVLHEQLAPFPNVSHFDEVLLASRSTLLPDFVLYVGEAIVSKRLKQFLRQATDARVWRVSATGSVEDVFMNLRGIVKGDAEMVLQALDDRLKRRQLDSTAYRREWLRLLTEAGQRSLAYQPPYSQMAAVRLFEQSLSSLPGPWQVHYANSTAIRLANIYAQHHVWCNRGVNGIEGSLSTAVGFSLRREEKVFCVIGDLSFFYDQNALWNQGLRGNLRILLLNNGKGGIFNMLPGLEQSPARDALVAARHHATAQGVCGQHDVYYQQATNMTELQQGIDLLLTSDFARPMLLEVMTSAEDDERVLREYYRLFTR